MGPNDIALSALTMSHGRVWHASAHNISQGRPLSPEEPGEECLKPHFAASVKALLEFWASETEYVPA